MQKLSLLSIKMMSVTFILFLLAIIAGINNSPSISAIFIAFTFVMGYGTLALPDEEKFTRIYKRNEKGYWIKKLGEIDGHLFYEKYIKNKY